MKAYVVFALLFVSILVGCAGPNPNIGERTTDLAWTSGNFKSAFNTARTHAESGEPWAQLRLAMFYENGWGVEHNIHEAIQWYEKVAAQKAEGGWAEGVMVGATGRIGYFNQNSDARIAQRNLAAIFLEGKEVEKDLLRAYMYIRAVVEETDGKPLFFCCEFNGGRFFPAKELKQLYQDVVDQMSPEEKAEAEKRFLQAKTK